MQLLHSSMCDIYGTFDQLQLMNFLSHLFETSCVIHILTPSFEVRWPLTRVIMNMLIQSNVKGIYPLPVLNSKWTIRTSSCILFDDVLLMDLSIKQICCSVYNDGNFDQFPFEVRNWHCVQLHAQCSYTCGLDLLVLITFIFIKPFVVSRITLNSMAYFDPSRYGWTCMPYFKKILASTYKIK